MKKNIIKTIVFIIIFCIILNIFIKILWLPPSPISCFYKEKDNTIDVVYVGSSNAYAHFNNVLAYKLYGFTTGLLSTDTQPISLVKYCLIESKKHQNPSLYIIDLALAGTSMDSFSGEEIRKTIDTMKFSKNRINAINETLSYKKDIKKEEYINYYFSFLLYHKAYNNIYWNLIKKSEDNLYKGYLFSENTIKVVPQDTYIWDNEEEQLPEENKKILIDLIEYIKENRLNVLFIIPIRCYKKEDNAKLNTAIKLIQENNLPVINCNLVDDLKNIDFSTDLYNDAHLNVYGATKFTLYFSKYIKEKYNLTDHKNDNAYASWNSEYKRFKAKFKELTNQDYDSLLNKYNINT